MADKYLVDQGGDLAEVEATTVSAGAANAGEIPALGADGKFDLSLFPAGIGGSAISLTTSESVDAGDFVNIHDSTGAKVRKADATNACSR